jgi:hypothetical protein
VARSPGLTTISTGATSSTNRTLTTPPVPAYFRLPATLTVTSGANTGRSPAPARP